VKQVLTDNTSKKQSSTDKVGVIVFYHIT